MWGTSRLNLSQLFAEVLDRQTNQLCPGTHPGFVEQLLQHRFDRGFRCSQTSADFLIRQTFKYTAQNLALALREAWFLSGRLTCGVGENCTQMILVEP